MIARFKILKHLNGKNTIDKSEHRLSSAVKGNVRKVHMSACLCVSESSKTMLGAQNG